MYTMTRDVVNRMTLKNYSGVFVQRILEFWSIKLLFDKNIYLIKIFN